MFSFNFFTKKAIVSGEIGDVISGKLAVPKGKTMIFKSLGKLKVKISCKPWSSHSLILYWAPKWGNHVYKSVLMYQDILFSC